jgi:hypothetical protein
VGRFKISYVFGNAAHWIEQTLQDQLVYRM